MKRKLLLTLVLSLTLGIAGVANAALFTNTVYPNSTVSGTGTLTWSHVVTSDLTVPYDTINWAYLSIVGKSWRGENDYVTVEQSYRVGTDLGALGPGFFNLYVLNIFEVDQVFSPGWGPEYGTFDVSLAYDEGAGNLTITSSNLTLSYNNNTAPVPEPGTMLLLGTGLVGLAAWGRKNFRK